MSAARITPDRQGRITGAAPDVGVGEAGLEHHDLVLAVTSHIPHLIAYTIVGTASDLEDVTRGEVIKYSAGGFRDFTRIAASDPVMWRDVFLTNKDAGKFACGLVGLKGEVAARVLEAFSSGSLTLGNLLSDLDSTLKSLEDKTIKKEKPKSKTNQT